MYIQNNEFKDFAQKYFYLLFDTNFSAFSISQTIIS